MDQALLREVLFRNIAARGLSADDVVVQVDGVWTPRELAGEECCLVVLEDFELADYAEGLLAFLGTLERAVLESWYRGFTRALFLAGAPGRLRSRFSALRHFSRSGKVAWTSPRPGREHEALRRLLKPLRTVDGRAVPRAGTRVAFGPHSLPARRLWVAVRGLTLEGYLIHLQHTLAEAFIAGHLHASQPLVLEHVEELSPVPERYDAMRVHVDPEDPSRLRAYAYLTPAT